MKGPDFVFEMDRLVTCASNQHNQHNQKKEGHQSDSYTQQSIRGSG